MLLSSDRTISYILCTKNKLPQLRHTVPDLLEGCREEDEIVVFDGASTDGSREYLEDYFNQGRFRVFRSEPDKNQAHGLNKAIFHARGEIVKVILDDDILHYSSIHKCAQFLIDHPEIDFLGATVGLAGYGKDFSIFRDLSKRQQFEGWLKGGKPFWFQDQSITYRRSSIPLVGLWHTGINCIDVEMTLRVSALRQAKLAWYTGTVGVHLMNEASLSLHPEYSSRVTRDIRRIFEFYGVECPPDRMDPTPLRRLRNILQVRTRLRAFSKAAAHRLKGTSKPKPYQRSFPEAYEECKQWLAANLQEEEARFLH